MPKKILIADDEHEVLDLVKVAIKNANADYQLITVMHGAHLPEIVEKEVPDLLILDVLLPGIDGYSLQLHFAQNEATKNIPVIILTALPASKSLFEKFSQVKCFMTKPFSTTELLSKVKEILGK